MTTFNESNAAITEHLTGRIIEHVIRKGKELHFVCSDSHVIVLQADVNGDIHYKKTDVSIMLPGVSMLAEAGRF